MSRSSLHDLETEGNLIPWLYRLFFLYIEPLSTAAGAYYAWFGQERYLSMTENPFGHGPAQQTHSSAMLPRESIVLNQLANMYAVFALNEAIVLRATNDLKVWRLFLLGLLLADFGHLHSVHSVGSSIYYSVFAWNAMYWGNLGFVYFGATMRVLFLLGVGIVESQKKTERQKR